VPFVTCHRQRFHGPLLVHLPSTRLPIAISAN
jgi:hypothetical protein